MSVEYQIKLPWGIKGGKLIHISEAVNGLGCGCVCPSCNSTLVAKNDGDERADHFSHYGKPDCGKALETAIHILAKEIIASEKKLFIPPVRVIKGNFLHTLSEGGIFSFDEVKLEEKTGDFIPDVICYKGEEPSMLVEIAVTHGVDNEKEMKIRENGISCLEIILDRERHYERESIKNFILGEQENDSLIWDESDDYGQFWVYNNFENIIGDIIRQMADCKEAVEWKSKKGTFYVNDCPKKIYQNRYGSYYAHPEDCKRCSYNVCTPEESGGYVHCIGRVMELKLLDKLSQKIDCPF